ncbi:MAG TPA: hypothetical protein EYP30_03695 [Archaeoglobaceae archaeon]|nr:hypothetical protein [Archaeoglobaceae archaeon]
MSEIDRVIEGRRGLYALLGTLFLEPPSRELLGDLFDGKKIPFLERLIPVAKKFHSLDEFESSVREEFSSLFIDPFGDTVSPYQSTYEGENPYGKVTQRIVDKFTDIGYEFRYSEPADHIGIELFFMAESCKNALESGKDEKIKELKNQKKFIEEELKWIFTFCDRIEGKEKSNFYREISKVLRDFLKNDRITINELIVSVLKS